MKHGTADVTLDTFPTALEKAVALKVRAESGVMLRHIRGRFTKTATAGLLRVMHNIIRRSWLRHFFSTNNCKPHQQFVTPREMDIIGCFYFGVCSMTLKTIMILLPRCLNHGPLDRSIRTKRDLLLSDAFMSKHDGQGNIRHMLARTHHAYMDQLHEYNDGDREIPEHFNSGSRSTKSLVRFQKTTGRSGAAGRIVLRGNRCRNRFSMYQVLNSTNTLIAVERSALQLFAAPVLTGSTISKLCQMFPGQPHSCFACGTVLELMTEQMTSVDVRLETPPDENESGKEKKKKKKKNKNKNKRKEREGEAMEGEAALGFFGQ